MDRYAHLRKRDTAGVLVLLAVLCALGVAVNWMLDYRQTKIIASFSQVYVN